MSSSPPASQTRDASQSTPQSFHLGTGASIFTNILIPAIASAKSEIIIVTCFWAPSKTLSALHDALAKIAGHRRRLVRERQEQSAPDLPPLRVRICLSSRSIFQKLFHPQSRDGYLYPPSSWQKALGLPAPDLLEAANIELRVRSLFFLPFSVMHPKFVIVDRQHAFVPSCNVSWEPWLEGCVEFTGDAVVGLLAFYTQTWERHDELDFRSPGPAEFAEQSALDLRSAGLASIGSPAHCRVALPAFAAPVPTVILPSSHHRNPRFRPWPWAKTPEAPKTPLNVALLELFSRAQTSLYVQTPNLTCEPVIAALLDALQRGVDVTVVTNRSMMLLEQLVTAGTTTNWCIKSLIRRFHQMGAHVPGRRRGKFSWRRGSRNGAARQDLEAGALGVGQLRILSFRARRATRVDDHEAQPLTSKGDQSEEPVHSHLKLTIIDGEFTVLGSGNMDRASWYTSQELGVLIHAREFAEAIKVGVERVLDDRLDVVFDSRDSRD
ncbi:hypothetical protein OQA88_5583 [Cercophora sp. LCS_1]